MAASDTATFHAGRRIGQPKMGLPRRTSPGSHIEPIDSLAWSPLGVHIPADFPHKDILFPPAHVARPPKFVQAPLLERADIVVWTDQDPDQDQVVVGSTVLKLQQRFPLHHKPAHLLDAIDGVAHFNYFLQRANTVNPIKGVALEMHCLRSDSGPGQHENLIKDGVAQLSSEEGAQYGFAIRNTSAEAFFPYLFYFDPERYTIHRFYSPTRYLKKDEGSFFSWHFPSRHWHQYAQVPLRSNGIQTIGMGDDRGIQLALEPGWESGVGFLKMFVTRQFVDLDWIEQTTEPFDLNFGGPNVGRERSEKIATWDALTVMLMVTVS